MSVLPKWSIPGVYVSILLPLRARPLLPHCLLLFYLNLGLMTSLLTVCCIFDALASGASLTRDRLPLPGLANSYSKQLTRRCAFQKQTNQSRALTLNHLFYLSSFYILGGKFLCLNHSRPRYLLQLWTTPTAQDPRNYLNYSTLSLLSCLPCLTYPFPQTPHQVLCPCFPLIPSAF